MNLAQLIEQLARAGVLGRVTAIDIHTDGVRVELEPQCLEPSEDAGGAEGEVPTRSPVEATDAEALFRALPELMPFVDLYRRDKRQYLITKMATWLHVPPVALAAFLQQRGWEQPYASWCQAFSAQERADLTRGILMLMARAGDHESLGDVATRLAQEDVEDEDIRHLLVERWRLNERYRVLLKTQVDEVLEN